MSLILKEITPCIDLLNVITFSETPISMEQSYLSPNYPPLFALPTSSLLPMSQQYCSFLFDVPLGLAGGAPHIQTTTIIEEPLFTVPVELAITAVTPTTIHTECLAQLTVSDMVMVH